jgi:hypothetical protein
LSNTYRYAFDIVDRRDELETAYDQMITRCYNRKKDGIHHGDSGSDLNNRLMQRLAELEAMAVEEA